ncbi:MAG: hypothetical protein ACRD18_11895 [Terriglobia bacterium]
MDSDTENRMNFMVQQQARFWTDIQALKERQEANLQQIEANRSMIRQLVDVSMSLTNSIQQLGADTDRRIKELGIDTDRRIKELQEAGAHSDRRLDALINVVDKLTRRNGGAS